jgi:hypothetical protein
MPCWQGQGSRLGWAGLGWAGLGWASRCCASPGSSAHAARILPRSALATAATMKPKCVSARLFCVQGHPAAGWRAG